MQLNPSKIMSFLQNKPFEALAIAAFILITVILVRLYMTLNEDEDWEKFKVLHHCQLRMSKTGIQRASWICDDGKTYYRWRQQR
jgi:hypothetical protein